MKKLRGQKRIEHLVTSSTWGRALCTFALVLSTLGCGRSEGEGSAAPGAGGTQSSSGGTSGHSGGTGGTGGTMPSDGGSSSSLGGAPSGRSGSGTVIDGVARLGEVCLKAGQLSCAGTLQKLTLVCGASEKWEVNETCDGDWICDTADGPNQGSCQPQLPECLGRESSGRFCEGRLVRECNVDNLRSEVIEECVVCRNGACEDTVDDSCVSESDALPVDCWGECQAAPAMACSFQTCTTLTLPLNQPVDGVLVRTPPPGEMCAPSCGAQFMHIRVPTQGTLRVTIPSGGDEWLLDSVATSEWPMGCNPDARAKCLIVPPTAEYARYVTLKSNTWPAPRRNIVIEGVGDGVACP